MACKVSEDLLREPKRECIITHRLSRYDLLRGDVAKKQIEVEIEESRFGGLNVAGRRILRRLKMIVGQREAISNENAKRCE